MAAHQDQTRCPFCGTAPVPVTIGALPNGPTWPRCHKSLGGPIAQRKADGRPKVEIADQTPKTHKPRTLYIDLATVDVLRQQRLRQLEMARTLYGEDAAAPKDVFTDALGGRLSPDTLSQRF